MTEVSKGANAAVYTLTPADPASLANSNLEFLQDEDSTEDGVAVHKYGAIIIPIAGTGETQVDYTAKAKLGDATYTATSAILVVGDATASPATVATAVGDTITLALDT